MLAALGFIVGEQLEDIPAFLNADGHITGPAIYQFQQVEARGAVFVSIFPTFSTVYLEAHDYAVCGAHVGCSRQGLA
jgi:hypothetical protein